jgi:squalene-hopene/tetraprenyl-beta-curcumene cyclase
MRFPFIDPRANALVACFMAGMALACSPAESGPTRSWNPRTAAAYLDGRQAWWMEWPGATRDHGTFCISCHTTVPYALSRPALRRMLQEDGPTSGEGRLIENVSKRVQMWHDVRPFYDGGPKAAESRGTEAVLNALVLASYDSHVGKLHDVTRSAFENMWALQQTSGENKGAWLWLQADLEPWEAKDSYYYGATVAAIAVGTAPENYRVTPVIQTKLELLREYLGREYLTQPSINQVGLLWASAKLPGLIKQDQQEAIINGLLLKQNADGGWSLSSLIGPWVRKWVRKDFTPQALGSDAYATGLVTFVLEQVGFSHENDQITRALSWLVRNQKKKEGLWQAYSLNKRRKSSSDAALFMSDAATAYAVLALTEGGNAP